MVATAVGVGVDHYLLSGNGPKHPKNWDPRVADIAKFVERERGLTFDKPVYVDFLTPAEYRKATAGDDADVKPTAKDREHADQQVAQFRALGLVQGKVDLISAYREVSDSGTLAFYSPETERVLVRGTEITPGLRVTLAHELTHALQDQHFDLKRIYKLQGVDDTLLRSVVEGDATRIENRYVATVLTATERSTYAVDLKKQSDNAYDKLEGDVPEVILTGFQIPYIFGPSFVDVLFQARGNSEVDKAIQFPPKDLEQIVDPLVYLAGQGPVKVAPFELPKGAKRLDSGSFGSVMWFLMLSERIDPRQSLEAIDGWGGDSMLTYERSGKVCVEGRFAGDTALDAHQMAVALRAWQADMPSGVATVTTADGLVSFKSCDPGAAANLHVSGRSSQALAYPALRTQIISGSLGRGATEKQAGCYGDAVVDKLTLAQINDQSGDFTRTPGFLMIVAAARRACL